MPRQQLKDLAEEKNVSLSTVERYWDQCEEAIDPEGNPNKGYGIVYECVEKKIAASKRSEG